MSDKRSTPLPGEQKDLEQPQESFESDTQKLVRKHMEDEDHVITEEEIRNVRVGMPAAPDAPTEEALRHSEEKIADRKTTNEDDTVPGEQKITPWDVIDQ